MALLKPSLRKHYAVATGASGSMIYGENGRQWIDAASGAIACTIGYGHPHVIAEANKAMKATSFLYRTQFTNEPAERLAARLCSRLGYAGAFFVNSGSEAVETAVRIAMQVWRERGLPSKTRILSRRLSYHGATSGALALSGHWPRRRTAGPLNGEPSQPTPFCFRCPLGREPSSCGLACTDALDDEIAQHGAENVAAFILEPIVGASGAAIVPPLGYLARVREICDRHGVLLIADEVLTGIGRTGAWLAMDHAGVKADIVCLGKGLNAGYLPISGVVISEPLHDCLRQGSGQFPLGHTHSNHPVAAAVANAVIDVVESEGLIERARTVGADFGARLNEIARDNPLVGQVRGTGMLWGLELVANRTDFAPFSPAVSVAEKVVAHAHDLGLVVYPASGFAGARGGDAIILAPPLNISTQNLDQVTSLCERALAMAARELGIC